MGLEIWNTKLGIVVLHCNPSLLHCIGKISYESSLYCGPFVWFSNCLFLWMWLIWHCLLFFSYSMFLWSTYGYLLFKPCIAWMGDNCSWTIVTTSASINNSCNGNDIKVFWILYLSWVCMTFILPIYLLFFWNLIICVITLSKKTCFSQ